MLRYRLIFGPLMIAVTLGAFWVDNNLDHTRLTGIWSDLFLGRAYPPRGVLLAAVAMVVLIPLGARELSGMFKAAGIAANTWVILLAADAACLTVYGTPHALSAPTGVAIVASVLIAAFLGTLIWHSRDQQAQGVVAAAGATMFAIALLGLMGGFYLAIRRWHAAWVVMAVVLITKSCDIGAYFTGRFFGRHRMIPWLSPKKTWEGLAGGIALAMLVGVGFAWISQQTNLAAIYESTEAGDRVLKAQHYSMLWGAVAGLVFGVVGQLGDLMVSLFKRDVGFKDSGHSIPGFGGVLDVFDSPLLVAPVAYWLLQRAWLG